MAMTMFKEICSTLFYIIAVAHGDGHFCAPDLSIIAVSTDNVQTQDIQPGSTRRLTVNCSVSGKASEEWTIITNLTLSHEFQKVASVDSDGYIEGGGIGAISSGGDSFLAKQWDFPDSDNEGSFQCQIRATAKSSKSENCLRNKQISANLKEKVFGCTTEVKIEIMSRRTNSKIQSIEVGLTKKLLVHCSVDLKKRYKSKFVTFMSLNHSSNPSKTISDLVASIQDHPFNEKRPKSGFVSYNLDEGYLSVVWNNPNFKNEGKYTCQTKLELTSGETEICTAEANIHAVNPLSCKTALKISATVDNKPPFDHYTDQIIREGITKKLILKCSVDNVKVLELDSMSALKLNFLQNKGYKANTLKEIKAHKYVDKRIGVISDTEPSFLNFERLSPKMNDAGKYTCEAIGKTADGKDHKCSVSLTISAAPKEKCRTSISAATLPIITEAQTSESNPNFIEPGSTERLMINCTFYYHEGQTLPYLELLTLQRTVGKEFQEVASIKVDDNYPIIKDSDAIAKGVVNKYGESYLYVEWTYPGHEKAKTYRCEARGGSHYHRTLETCTSSVEISLREMPLKSITQHAWSSYIENIHAADAISTLNESMMLMNETVTLLNDDVTELNKNNTCKKNKKKTKTDEILASNVAKKFRDETLSSLLNLFIQSWPYNGRRYYLAKSATVVSPEIAQIICAKYEGYLAEINDPVEFHFLRTFLDYTKANVLFRAILVSGSMDLPEMSFSYVRDKTKAIYIPWANGHPKKSYENYCIYLKRLDELWYAHNIQCTWESNYNIKFSYICEIED